MDYCMTEGECQNLLGASKPTMAIIAGVTSSGEVRGMPRSPQENADSFWYELGRRYGFKWDTAKPIAGKGPRHFSAEPLPEED